MKKTCIMQFLLKRLSTNVYS